MNISEKIISGMKVQVRSGLFLVLLFVLAGCGGGAGGEGDGSPVGIGAEESDGTATLSWVAPSTRVDNSTLSMSEIGGYKVYMGTGASTSDLSLYQDINDPYQMELVVEGLSPGTYYFAVTAYDQYGVESDFSVVASKTI